MASEDKICKGHIMQRKERQDAAKISENVFRTDACSCGCCQTQNEHRDVHAHSIGACNCGCTQEEKPEGLKQKIFILVGAAALFAVASVFHLHAAWKLSLFAAAYLLSGWDVLREAGQGLVRGKWLNETFLMALASMGAFLIGEYAEGVAVMLFYQVGELFQNYAVDHSRRSIEDLMDIRPDTANRFDGKVFAACPAEFVHPGDLILVRPGEKVPLDGVVEQGASQLDTSALTGEPLPREIEEGQPILAGCINLNGALKIRVTKSFGDSTVSKILDMVEHASTNKAPQEQFITRFARYYTPAVVSIAALIALIPPLFFQGAWSDYIHRALVFLVISCPCALVISVPLGFFAGIGCSSRKGILVKGGNYLDALCLVDTVVLDKTGTLTKGTFSVLESHPVGCTQQELLSWAAQAESCSTHPIARSLMEAASIQSQSIPASDIKEIAGRGISARVAGKTILVGNRALLSDASVSAPEVHGNGTIVYVAVDGSFAGYILIGDTPRPESKEALQLLKQAGIKHTVMLTGDHFTAAEQIGREVGIDAIHADLLPNDKVAWVEKLLARQSKGKKLLFVGDGMNDAPVLARADIGVAMGGLGSDAAIEAADIVLMNDSLAQLPTAVQIAKHTHRIVMQNIVLALGVKLIVLILGGLGHANMWAAVFADVGVCLIAILNSLRALSVKE